MKHKKHKLDQGVLGKKTATRMILPLAALFAGSFYFSSTSNIVAEPYGATTYKPIQLASTYRRYNFSRERVGSQRYSYKKKKKFKKSVKRRSYSQRLKDIQAWQVDENNKDPIQLIVSRTKQQISVYKGAELVTTSKVSSGKRGHETPTGVFSILGKKVFHRSNIYSAAPMPYMQRLTWSGVALHASNSVPNHPASHGCVRLPNGFAPKLFKFTERGAHVIIADENPRIVEFNGLDLLKPLSLEEREAELAKLKEKLVAEKMAELKAAREKEAAIKARETSNKDTEQAQVTPQDDAVEPEVPEVDVTLSESPLRILITRRLGRERVMDVQDMLKELGYDPGERDGYMGKDTGKAILAFQKANGFKETGAFSDALEAQLYKRARNAEAPTGYIYVRQDFKDLLSAPITIKEPHRPLGTHLITAQYFAPGDAQVRWRAMTLKDEVPEFLAQEEERDKKQSDHQLPREHVRLAQLGSSPILVASNGQETPSQMGEKIEAEAKPEKEQIEQQLNMASKEKIAAVLARISIPDEVGARLSFLLTPGSSIAISDKGLSKETTPHGTDFILLTR